MGRDLYRGNSRADSCISTHTPAWGVTSFTVEQALLIQISTHTPAWGVTGTACQCSPQALDFNSHARVGRDLQLFALLSL